jgi:hypothetical protein
MSPTKEIANNNLYSFDIAIIPKKSENVFQIKNFDGE